MFIDPSPGKGPATPGERWAVVIGILVITGLFLAEIFQNFTPVKLSALFFLLFWPPLLALHEAGHAMMARILGWHVGQIVIGFGKPFTCFLWGRALVEIRMLPVEGFVRCVPTDLSSPRLKNALIYFAGPGIELALAGALLAIVGPDLMFSSSQNYGVIAVQSLALAATSGAVLNLIPHAKETGSRSIANDGLGIIQCLFHQDAYYANQVGQTFNPKTGEWEEHDPADWWKRRSNGK